jgi:hypothetical protein
MRYPVYLFRNEYIFDLEKAVVVETPQLGHATYVFAKPRSMEGFLVLYTKITKEDIRRNRDHVGERLGFLGRIIHGTKPRAWLKEMRQRLGEKLDFASSLTMNANRSGLRLAPHRALPQSRLPRADLGRVAGVYQESGREPPSTCNYGWDTIAHIRAERVS